MFGKIITAIIVTPLVVVIVAFAVANRQLVTVSLDPFGAAKPAYSSTMPLFVLIFVVLIFGVILGGFAAWLGQGGWRRTARRLDADVRALHEELATLRRRFGTAVPPSAPADRASPQVVPPVE